MQNRFIKFSSLIQDIERSINKIKKEEMTYIGLKGVQVECIYQLYNNGKLTQGSLCKLCREDKGAMSRILKELISEGFIMEEESEKKYKNHLYLTDKGQEVAEVINQKIEERFAQGRLGMDNNVEEFYRQLSLISDNLKKICEEYKND